MLTQERVEGLSKLTRLMLVVARQEGQVGTVALDAGQPAVPDRSANAAPDVVPNHQVRPVGARLVSSPIVGAVIHDDRLKAAVSWESIEDAADLASLVEGRND